MWARVTVKEAPASLPLDAEGLRARLRIDGGGEDALLGEFLAAAAAEIEGPQAQGVAMMAQTWTLTLDAFPREIALPGWPITGVAAIRYLDRDGVERTLDPSAYRLALGVEPARVVVRPGVTWPATLAGPSAVMVDYTLGRAAAADVDAGLVTALALLAGHYYENREATVLGPARELPLGVQHILGRFRRGVVG